MANTAVNSRAIVEPNLSLSQNIPTSWYTYRYTRMYNDMYINWYVNQVTVFKLLVYSLNNTGRLLFYITSHSLRVQSVQVRLYSKLCIPSAFKIDLLLWHTQLIVCAENVKSWVFPFTFQAYILPHTVNCMCVSLFKFHIWILEQF